MRSSVHGSASQRKAKGSNSWPKKQWLISTCLHRIDWYITTTTADGSMSRSTLATFIVVPGGSYAGTILSCRFVVGHVSLAAARFISALQLVSVQGIFIGCASAVRIFATMSTTDSLRVSELVTGCRSVHFDSKTFSTAYGQLVQELLITTAPCCYPILSFLRSSVTSTILRVPYCTSSIMGPKTLAQKVWPACWEHPAAPSPMRVSENRGPCSSALNSRILIIRTTKIVAL